MADWKGVRGLREKKRGIQSEAKEHTENSREIQLKAKCGGAKKEDVFAGMAIRSLREI